MKKLLDHFASKLAAQGLAHPDEILLLGLDAEVTANRPGSPFRTELERVFGMISVTSLLFSTPEEPYRSIIRSLTAQGQDRLVPSDCETRTFFHDIPVIDRFRAEEISRALSLRKAAIVRGAGIVSCGTVSPEQAFVSYSSACFSTFVKYFTGAMFSLEDSLRDRRPADPSFLSEFAEIVALLPKDAPPAADIPENGPDSEGAVIDAIVRTGRALVGHRLVDSYFGNISCVWGEKIYISQTGSSLDELETTIDAVPLDGSSSAGITASSELSAHLGIYRATGCRTIVHGHPKFSVIMSMACREPGCDPADCYRTCVKPRRIGDVPVVSGEIGTGPTGLARTVPAALAGSDAAAVFGHGVFTTGRSGFRAPFLRMREIEEASRRQYIEKMKSLARQFGSFQNPKDIW
ncbi:MAG: class II aldolase/adducin family protein [Thermodesulfovibrionales bacterium]